MTPVKFGKFTSMYCSEHLLQLTGAPQPGHGNKGGWSLWKCVFRLCTYPRHCSTVSVQEVEIKPRDSSRLCSAVTKPPLVIRHQVFPWNNQITAQLHARADTGLGAGQGILGYGSKNTKSLTIWAMDTRMPILPCSEMPPFVGRYT